MTWHGNVLAASIVLSIPCFAHADEPLDEPLIADIVTDLRQAETIVAHSTFAWTFNRSHGIEAKTRTMVLAPIVLPMSGGKCELTEAGDVRP